jgi:phasin
VGLASLYPRYPNLPHFLTAQHILRRKKESGARVRKRTEAPATVSHIWSDAVRDCSASGPHHGGEFFPEIQFRLKGRRRVNQANAKEMNADPKADDKHSGMPFLAVPGIFEGLAEQNMSRAKESIEKMKVASGALNDALLQAYSANAKGAADYAAKVIEFSAANTSSAFDFFTHLLGTKLPSEILQLSAAQGCKNFGATAAQSRELWELTRKVASETADPIKKSFASVLQKAA